MPRTSDRAPKDETAQMLEMRQKLGMTYRQIGDRFGLSVHSVYVRLGLKPTRRALYRRPDEPGYRAR